MKPAEWYRCAAIAIAVIRGERKKKEIPFARNTVIAFDARGHGQSDKPHDVESYDYQLMVGNVTAIMDALGVAKTYYWGYSMGGYIGLGIAKHVPDRLVSLILGGATPFGSSESTKLDRLNVHLLKIFRRGLQEGIDAVLEGMRELAGSITPQYEARLRSLDPAKGAVKISRYENHKGNLTPEEIGNIAEILLPKPDPPESENVKTAPVTEEDSAEDFNKSPEERIAVTAPVH